jgi:hypothetical protein
MTATAVRGDTGRVPRWLAIFLVSLAGLLLEVGYTRIVSYKLWYYYTYLVIGLALLGIGSGGVLVAVSSRIRQASTDRIIAAAAIWGAISIPIGYFVISRLPVHTIAIWNYWSGSSFWNLFLLSTICFAIFATFIAFGVIVSVLLGRAGEGVGRMYFADLIGAALGCFVAIPLISRYGPPRVIMFAALVFAVVGVLYSVPRSASFIVATAAAVILLLPVLDLGLTAPDVRPEKTKLEAKGALYSDWGPVFRVDVAQTGGDDDYLLVHDGTFGSGIRRFDGNAAALDKYETDPRSLPFRALGEPPEHELIVGSAGGQEILTSLYFRAPDIEAVELNPVTTGILTGEAKPRKSANKPYKTFEEYTGRLADRPEVHLTQGDGRTYLARSDTDYDLIWYVAPDSYAATNAASSGAFVLSESYLYTKEMIKETLEHLSEDGIMAVQFGELSFEQSPARTSRYIVTARKALEELGVEDASQHLLVAAQNTSFGDLSTILVKRTPFTQEEADGFLAGVANMNDHQPIAAPGHNFGDHVVSRLARGTPEEVDQIVDDSKRSISAISDDAPYFWHFSKFSDVISNIGESLDVRDPEDVIGERVLLLLLGISIVYAALFLLAPFWAVRRKWQALPAKGTSAIYFACLGLGFMFFEITMIQRLVLFLGYPTLSLTVTLAAILVSTGFGALLSKRFVEAGGRVMPYLVGILAVLTIFYLFAVPPLLTGSLLEASVGVRILISIVLLFPLGLCLGMFMPLGLGRVSSITEHGEEYVAWAWAVNGFFSVIGSVLTTILSMALGFRVVQALAFGVYVIAAIAFTRLPSALQRGSDVATEARAEAVTV